MKILMPILFVGIILFFLISAAVDESAKKVVTVSELLSLDQSSSRERIRLGARVAKGDINVVYEPEQQVEFPILDIESETEETIQVIYKGMMPDTLREGRDVILEGDYKNGVFKATSLTTQCPSKYEPPDPTTDIDNVYSQSS